MKRGAMMGKRPSTQLYKTNSLPKGPMEWDSPCDNLQLLCTADEVVETRYTATCDPRYCEPPGELPQLDWAPSMLLALCCVPVLVNLPLFLCSNVDIFS